MYNRIIILDRDFFVKANYEDFCDAPLWDTSMKIIADHKAKYEIESYEEAMWGAIQMFPKGLRNWFTILFVDNQIGEFDRPFQEYETKGPAKNIFKEAALALRTYGLDLQSSYIDDLADRSDEVWSYHNQKIGHSKTVEEFERIGRAYEESIESANSIVKIVEHAKRSPLDFIPSMQAHEGETISLNEEYWRQVGVDIKTGLGSAILWSTVNGIISSYMNLNQTTYPEAEWETLKNFPNGLRHLHVIYHMDSRYGLSGKKWLANTPKHTKDYIDLAYDGALLFKANPIPNATLTKNNDQWWQDLYKKIAIYANQNPLDFAV